MTNIIKYYFRKLPIILRWVVFVNLGVMAFFVYVNILSSIWSGADLFAAWLITIFVCFVNFVAYIIYSVTNDEV